MFSSLDISGALENEDTLALATTFRLGNKSCILFAPTKCLKVTETEGKYYSIDFISLYLYPLYYNNLRQFLVAFLVNDS